MAATSDLALTNNETVPDMIALTNYEEVLDMNEDADYTPQNLTVSEMRAKENYEMGLDLNVDADYTPNFHTNECKDVNTDSILDVSPEASTNADVGGVNMGVIVNDSTLAKEPINANEETVCNKNVGIDKYLARSMRRLEKLSDLGIDPHELSYSWKFIPTDKVGDTVFPGPDGAAICMKEVYGVPNAQPILDGPEWYTLADGGDGHYYFWNQHCSGTVRIELTDIHEILEGIREEGPLGIPHTILGFC